MRRGHWTQQTCTRVKIFLLFYRNPYFAVLHLLCWQAVREYSASSPVRVEQSSVKELCRVSIVPIRLSCLRGLFWHKFVKL